MLNIHIDDPELEQNIKQDIDVSIEQLDAGESVPLRDAINDIRVKYE